MKEVKIRIEETDYKVFEKIGAAMSASVEEVAERFLQGAVYRIQEKPRREDAEKDER